MNIVTLEDRIAPETPTPPIVPQIIGTSAQMAIPSGTAPHIVAMMPMRRCNCGSCSRCHSQSQWGYPQSQPTINVTVSPNITAQGGDSYAEGVRQHGMHSPVPTNIDVEQQPVHTVERPVFVDRVHEVVNQVTKPVYIPVREVVERIKQTPLFMPFQTKKPVDRAVPMPLKVPQPVDRTVPIPLKVPQPVDRTVIVPVNPAQTNRPVRPPQPFQTVTNKRDQTTDVNYFG